MTDIVEEMARAMAADQAKRHYGIDRGPAEAWGALTEYGRAERRAEAQAAYTIVERRIGELQRVAEQGEAALQAMMDAWFDFHDHHSLTQPVTGAAGCAFELALEARDKIRASLEQRSDQ
jgi:hypothetical protein